MRSRSRRVTLAERDEIELHRYGPPALRLRAEQFAVILGGKHSISELVRYWLEQHHDLARYATYFPDDDDKRAEIERRLAEREESMTALVERLDKLEERRGATCRN